MGNPFRQCSLTKSEPTTLRESADRVDWAASRRHDESNVRSTTAGRGNAARPPERALTAVRGNQSRHNRPSHRDDEDVEPVGSRRDQRRQQAVAYR